VRSWARCETTRRRTGRGTRYLSVERCWATADLLRVDRSSGDNAVKIQLPTLVSRTPFFPSLSFHPILILLHAFQPLPYIRRISFSRNPDTSSTQIPFEFKYANTAIHSREFNVVVLGAGASAPTLRTANSESSSLPRDQSHHMQHPLLTVCAYLRRRWKELSDWCVPGLTPQFNPLNPFLMLTVFVNSPVRPQ